MPTTHEFDSVSDPFDSAEIERQARLLPATEIAVAALHDYTRQQRSRQWLDEAIDLVIGMKTDRPSKP